MADLFDEYVETHGRELVRFCTALAGVAASTLAGEGLVALSRRDVASGRQVAHRAVLQRVVRSYLLGSYRSPEGTTAAAWAAAVLVTLEHVPPAELAWFVGEPVSPAEVEVRIPRRGQLPEDLGRRGRAATVIMRRGRRRRIGAVAAIAALLLLVATTTYRTVTHVARPDVASGTGFIKWVPRGDLLLDEQLRGKAAAVWRAATSGRLTDLQTLWAGHVGGGRLVVLQGYGSDGVPQVGAVGETESGLALLRSDAMPIAPDLLLIPYSGLPELSLTSYSQGARLVRALIDPAAAMERRSLPVRAFDDVDKLGPWLPLRPRDGLSEPWLDLSGSFAQTALRDRGVTYLVKPTDSLLPTKPVVVAGPTRLRADAEQVPDEQQIVDDVLAIEQYATVPAVDVNLVWAGPLSMEADFLRLYNLVPRPGCPDDCDSGLWAVGDDGTADPVDGLILDGSLVLHGDGLVALIGAPGSTTCNLGGADVERLSPAHLVAADGPERTFTCRDGAGGVVSAGTILKP